MLITNFEADAVWYEPEYADNRDLPEDSRMSVLIEPLSKREAQRAEESASTIRAGKKAKINFTKRHNEMRDRIMKTRVREVVGLAVQSLGEHGQVTGVREITTAHELIANANDDLLNDIFEAMRDGSHLAEGVRGKSESVSVCNSPPEAQSGTGAALAAEATSTKSKTNGARPVDASKSSQVSTSTSSLVYSDAPGVS